MARTCIQNGPHLQHFLTGFAVTKTGTCPAGPQNVRFTLDLRPQNGSHLETRKTINSKWRALAFKTGHICSSKWCTLAFQSGRAFHSRWAASPQGGPQASLKAGRRHPSRSAASPHESVPQASLKVADNLSPSSAKALPPRLVPLGVPNPVAPKSAFEASSPNSTKSSSNSTRGTDPLRKRTIPAINKRPAFGWRQPFVFLYLVLSWYQLIRNTNYIVPNNSLFLV